MKINFFNHIGPEFTGVMEEKKFKTRSELYTLEKIIKDTLEQVFKKERIK